MNDFIYSGTLHINGEEISAMWTTDFSTIWAENRSFKGYHELVNYIHNK